MKQILSIEELYAGLIEEPGECNDESEGGIPLFVVPKIRYDFYRSDYLYQLYRPLVSVGDSGGLGSLGGSVDLEGADGSRGSNGADGSEGIVHHSARLSVRSLTFWEHGWLLKAALRNPNRTLLHYHWFEIQDLRSLAGMGWKWFCLFWYKKRGGKIVWTIHNHMPHNPVFPRLNLAMRRWLASISDRIHLHCREIATDVQEFYRVDTSKIIILPHPTFEARILDRETARNTLSQTRCLPIDPSDTLFLMFGQISHYKQIEPVCEIFASMRKPESLAEPGPDSGVRRLLVAGPVKKGQEAVLQRIRSIANRSENIHIIADWISDEEMDLLFSASDSVILNMKEIWMSGVAIMACSYQKPLILPKTGCLPSLSQPASPSMPTSKQTSMSSSTPSSMLHFFTDQQELSDAIHQFRRPL